MNKIECFKIQVLKTDDIFDIKNGEVIKQINCETNTIVKEPKTIQADPFLFVSNNILYLFYEDKKMYKSGVISMIFTKNLVDWSNPVTVLEEECHLSYPWVFEDGGCIYMIPETSADNSIRIYKAVDSSLSKFVFKKCLLKDKRKNMIFGY